MEYIEKHKQFLKYRARYWDATTRLSALSERETPHAYNSVKNEQLAMKRLMDKFSQEERIDEL